MLECDLPPGCVPLSHLPPRSAAREGNSDIGEQEEELSKLDPQRNSFLVLQFFRCTLALKEDLKHVFSSTTQVVSDIMLQRNY